LGNEKTPARRIIASKTKDGLSMNYITRWINHQFTEHDMTWNKRAKYAIGKHKESLLVYMTDANEWLSSKDVYVKLMYGANRLLRGE
jgi:hypothetical protein